MLKFVCPICEIETDETELMSGGEAHLKRTDQVAVIKIFMQYLFEEKS